MYEVQSQKSSLFRRNILADGDDLDEGTFHHEVLYSLERDAINGFIDEDYSHTEEKLQHVTHKS